MVFFGPLGPQGSNLIRYLQSTPEMPPIGEDMNPASWMLSEYCIMNMHAGQFRGHG